MKIKLNKKSATIELESAEEIANLKQAVEWYMDMIYEEDNSNTDEFVKALDSKFNKDSVIKAHVRGK